MEHRVTTSPDLSPHSLGLARLAIASVWGTLLLLASGQEISDLSQRRQPADAQTRQS